MKNAVIIIGASSSGLYAAELLTSASTHVAVYEREEELNPTRRTYIITTGLKQIMEDFPSEGILHSINKMAVEHPGNPPPSRSKTLT